MNKNIPHRYTPAPLGKVEPHAHFLTVPPDEQLLYKIMSVENLLRSLLHNYIHFHRVADYTDFPSADPHDGKQLPKDKPRNKKMRFKKAPDFSAADYYDKSRARSYACCFSLENSKHIWDDYANDNKRGKVCVVFKFWKLRAAINQFFNLENAELKYSNERCKQIFDLNYGIIKYVEWENHQVITDRYPNPIQYIYLKDKKYEKDKELRISLSAIGLGEYAFNDGSIMDFPSSLSLAFDFKAAIADKTIQHIEYAADCDFDFLQTELHKLHIVTSKE